ncbi:MAG: hypothetical protein ABGX07_08700 [Pirellulaceae bacterium]|jgi:hypothetical protein|nr:hypothetical protein [Planctomycetaceae bacterium]HIM31124.1 hypothetical protein [Planctomycetota bacterium]
MYTVRRIGRRWLALAGITLATLTQNSVANDYRLEVGKPHPDFVLPDIATGEARRLSDFRGQKVVLIHFASW